MARWLIQLEGEQFDIEEIPYWFPNGEVHAITEEASVYLTGPGLEKYLQPDQVHEAAHQIVDEFSAIIALLQRNFRKPSVGMVVREDDGGDRKLHHFLQAEPATLRLKGRGTLSVAGETKGPNSLTQAQRLLTASRVDRYLHVATSILGDPIRTWPRLYRVLEEIENHLKCKVHEAGLCTEKERRRFTHTANTAEVAGIDARHGSDKFDPPKEPMPFAEAQAFVTTMLDRTLRQIVVPDP